MKFKESKCFAYAGDVLGGWLYINKGLFAHVVHGLENSNIVGFTFEGTIVAHYLSLIRKITPTYLSRIRKEISEILYFLCIVKGEFQTSLRVVQFFLYLCEDLICSNTKLKFMCVCIFIIIILGTISACAQSSDLPPVKIKITGEIDSTYQASTLLIIRQNDNIRKPKALIPVVKGKIDFDFETEEPDRFSLISLQDMTERGTWIPVDFFAEDGEIHITGGNANDGSQCLKLNVVESTSSLNSRLIEYNSYDDQTFRNRLDSIVDLIRGLEDHGRSSAGKALEKELNALSKEISQYPDSLSLLQHRSELYQRLDSLKRNRAMYTPEYYKLYEASKAVANEKLEYEIDTYGGPDGDLFSLSVLFQAFMMTNDNAYLRERIINSYIDNFRDRFTNTQMGRRMEEAVIGYEVSHVGGRYPNYQLPDDNGNMHNIYDLINGRLVLIDLWGSTCVPCRVNSRLLISVYNEFKDKGFDVIGIAREYGSLDGFNQAVQKDGYPWCQLIELNDATGIFNLHGIPDSMGGTYLVGPSITPSSDNGIATDIRILLINPTPAQLREFLLGYYGEQS